MRETNFIKQKKEKWVELERTMRQTNPDPDKLNDLFVQITDDLSYSRTFYPNRSVRVYLNGLAQQVFYSIYKNKKSTAGKFLSFWTKDLPLVLYDSRRELWLGIFCFWIPFIAGWMSGVIDPEFPRMLLGDEYIDMTLDNIEAGDPMGVYKDDGKFTMFLYIFLNNLWVTFRYFIVGVLFSIGSVASLIFFGLYVGGFQFFFYEQDELIPSILGIWTHGSLEIPAAILAGVAGIVLGKGLVFPGTYSRLQAFLLSARKGVKIMIGTIPLVFLAAFLESYVTRLTETPDIIRATFILFCFASVAFYYIIYPWRLGRRVKEREEDERLQPDANTQVHFGRIKSSGEIFKDIFVVYGKNLGRIMSIALMTGALYVAGNMLLAPGKPSDLFAYPTEFMDFMTDLILFFFGELFGDSKYISQFFNYSEGWFAPQLWVNILVYSILSFGALQALKKTYQNETSDLDPVKTPTRDAIFDFAKVLVVVSIANGFLLAGETWGIFLFLFFVAAPFLLLWMAIMVLEGTNVFSGIGRTFQLMFTWMSNTIILYFLLGIITLITLMLIFSPVMLFVLQNFGYNISTTQDTMDELLIIGITFMAQTIFGLVFPMVVMGFGLLYYSQVEIRDAKSLMERVETIGSGRRIRGLERE